jgi:hypothetical protein
MGELFSITGVQLVFAKYAPRCVLASWRLCATAMRRFSVNNAHRESMEFLHVFQSQKFFQLTPKFVDLVALSS